MKLKNHELTTMSQLFGKMLYADFEDFEVALQIANYATKIDDAMAGVDKLRKVLSEKAQALDKESATFGEDMGKLNQELNKILDQEVIMPTPPKVKKEWLKGKIRPIEAKLLMDHKIMEVDKVKK